MSTAHDAAASPEAAAIVRVVGLDHLVLRCADVDTTLQWYTDVLGLSGVRVDAWRRGEVFFPSVRIDPSTIIDLIPRADTEDVPTPGHLDHLCLVVGPGVVDAVSTSGEFHVVDGPDHRFGARGTGWSVYVLDPDDLVVELRSYDRPAPGDGRWATVNETGRGGLENEVVASGHGFLVDEPPDIGGHDAGPAPFDLLASALGACTSMTLRLYADRKRMPLERISVEVDHRKEAEPGGGKIDVFERRIHLFGPLTDADRERLLAIANRCPVHLTLERGSRIDTTVAP